MRCDGFTVIYWSQHSIGAWSLYPTLIFNLNEEYHSQSRTVWDSKLNKHEAAMSIIDRSNTCLQPIGRIFTAQIIITIAGDNRPSYHPRSKQYDSILSFVIDHNHCIRCAILCNSGIYTINSIVWNSPQHVWCTMDQSNTCLHRQYHHKLHCPR